MITLIQAFRLLDIRDEGVYLTTPGASRLDCFWFWSDNIRKLFDMKKVKVLKIRRHFTYDHDDPDYEFVVRGITTEELRRIHTKMI